MRNVEVGAAARQERAAVLDAWLGGLFADAIADLRSEVAVQYEPVTAASRTGLAARLLLRRNAGPGAAGPAPMPPASAPPAGSPPVEVSLAGSAASWSDVRSGDLASAASGVALIATGGLGRRECAPYGDVDLLLIHDGRPGITEAAAKIWYPIWDANVGLDHAVRTVPEALSVAVDDVRVALSLLDSRLVAGDPDLAAALRSAGLDQWRRTAGRSMVRMREARSTRIRAHGELAFLLEGDLKESGGGLRDVQILRAISTLGITDAYRPAVRAAHRRLLDVRDALHASAGRRIDRILAQDRDLVAKRLDLRDGDALLRRVSTDARAIAYALDDAWRAVERWRSAPVRSGRTPVARDVVAQDGELLLARAAIGPAPDPSLPLRVAAASATSHMPIARATLEWLARFAPALPTPWPAAARQAFVTLLGASDQLVRTWEACDRYGLIGTWLPDWNRLRGLPQHHPIHIYTVDRHSVQCVVEAHAYKRDVSRPDLLLVAALLHDVGKGLPGDHSDVGAPVAAAIAAAIGFPPEDVATVETVVRLHLLLPNIATRRDINDPVTVAQVADAVGDVETLDLLHALCRADAVAAGPSASSPWKTRLIGRLAANVRALLDTGAVPAPARLDAGLTGRPLPAVDVTGTDVTIAAVDRRGLLAAVAAVLAVHRLDVVGADTATIGDTAVVRMAVEPRFGRTPDANRLTADLKLAAAGEFPLDRVARAGGARSSLKPTVTEPKVSWHDDASAGSVVLELRAADAPGLLFRVTRALADAGADVLAARVATLGGDVVDAFYLAGEWAQESERVRLADAAVAAVRASA